MAPSVFIVPGIYEGPASFEPLVASLQKQGIAKVVTTKLRSTGTTSNDTVKIKIADDVAWIAEDLAQTVEDAGDEGVVCLLHSAGGSLGSAALKGLTVGERKAAGKVGGVSRIIFLASVISGENVRFTPEFMEFDHDKGLQSCKNPMDLLFHDLPKDQAESWASKIQCQPSDYFGSALHAGWKDVPSVWLITKNDRMVPCDAQESAAELTGGKIVRLDTGHVPQLSIPDELARIVVDVVEARV